MFHTATPDQIKSGKVTDVYFDRTVKVLRARGLRKHVVAEVRAASLPNRHPWAVLAGIEETAHLLEGLPVRVASLVEGSVFRAGEPVLWIEGEYTEFAVFETPLLGMLCQASGVATKAARCRIAAVDRQLISFGARRMHPALAPMIDRNAFLGGCDAVSVVQSAECIGEQPVGTMPHALVLCVGAPVTAFKLFHEVVSPDVRRVCLVDTMHDEKFEAVAAAEALRDQLFAVRLDTPGSRRGDILRILQEVRWELDLRGFKHVKLFLSGGVDEAEIIHTRELVDAYGVGTSISNAPVINFAMDIVEVDGQPLSKRGKESGRKQLIRCHSCGQRIVVPVDQAQACPGCGGQAEGLLTPLLTEGALVRELPPVQELRRSVLSQLKGLSLE